MLKAVVRLALACLLVVPGCGPSGPEIASVVGTVKMDGKPLPHAIVMFVPQGGRPSVAEADENGKYVLQFSGGRKGAIPGLNRVEINTFAPMGYEVDGTVIPGRKEVVPARYNRFTTLEFEVQPGKKNIADFDLESSGKVIADNAGY